MNKNKVKLLIGTFVIHRILLETLLLDPVNTISRQINDENVRNLKVLASVCRMVSIRALNGLFSNEMDDFEDNLTEKVYSKAAFKNLLKAEWIQEARKIYNEWLDSFTAIINSPNKMHNSFI